MTEPKLIAEFKLCPYCGGKDLVSALGLATVFKGKDMPFSSLRRDAIPLEQPQLAGITVPVLVVHYDVCAGCGMERCTKAEIIQAPVTASPQQPQFRVK